MADTDDNTQLAQQLEQRAGALRATYPAGLEHDLDEQWRQVRGRVHDGEQASVQEAIDALGARRFSVPEIEMTSSFPGGSAVHKLVTKTVERHFADLVTQLDAYADLTLRALSTLAAATEEAQDETRGQLAALTGELADLRRAFNRSSRPE